MLASAWSNALLMGEWHAMAYEEPPLRLDRPARLLYPDDFYRGVAAAFNYWSAPGRHREGTGSRARIGERA